MTHETDPRITAYVFGELSAEDREQFETELQASPALRRLVDETRQTLDLLSGELRSEPPLQLTDRQRELLSREIAAPPGGCARQPEKNAVAARGNWPRRPRSSPPVCSSWAVGESLGSWAARTGTWRLAMSLRLRVRPLRTSVRRRNQPPHQLQPRIRGPW
jgi:anti-sigma factor RsiW